MTTSEYLGTPETVQPRELAYGVLHVAESPVVSHQRIARDLTIVLALHVREHGLGEVLPAPMDVILDHENDLVVQPDLLFVAAGRNHIVSDRIYGAPDLVVEILSPNPRVGRLHEKIEWFARYGVKECWLVDLDQRQIAVLTFDEGQVVGRSLSKGAESVRSTILPDLGLRAVDLFGYQ